MYPFLIYRKGKKALLAKKYSQLPLFFQHKLDLTGFKNTIAHAKFR